MSQVNNFTFCDVVIPQIHSPIHTFGSITYESLKPKWFMVRYNISQSNLITDERRGIIHEYITDIISTYLNKKVLLSVPDDSENISLDGIDLQPAIISNFPLEMGSNQKLTMVLDQLLEFAWMQSEIEEDIYYDIINNYNIEITQITGYKQ